MSLIDVENAKQIRDPMTVLIKMEVPEDVTASYNNFSNVKIKDEELTERSWSMRRIADLQGDGFNLDGTHELYDSTEVASAANGKIGVRGDVGQDLTFTVTGDDTIQGLSVMATGSTIVHYGGHVATIVGGQVIIPVGASSITLTFEAAESTERVEVSLAMPGTSIQVANDSIISCIVSLRADLSIESPTLPESELNVEIYNDVDISEAVASIPDDTPITYSAGYPTDMSPTRKFYISGQITWKDNILSIHAVDGVHLLDVGVQPVEVGYSSLYFTNSINYLEACILSLIKKQGVTPSQSGLYYLDGWTSPDDRKCFYIPRSNLRDVIAFCNNVFRIDDVPEDAVRYLPVGVSNSFWFSYIDAGIPKMTDIKPSAKWSIDESDCGEPSKDVQPQITDIEINHTEASLVFGDCGSVTWEKGGAAFPNYDGLAESYIAYVSPERIQAGGYYDRLGILPVDTNGYRDVGAKYLREELRCRYSPTSVILLRLPFRPLIDNETLQNIESTKDGTIYTQVIPKNSYRNPAQTWVFKTDTQAWNALVNAGIISSADKSVELTISADHIQETVTAKTYTTGTHIKKLEVEEKIFGNIYFRTDEGYQVAYPDMAMQSLLQRSSITGSFTWKGDPRMQPRDVVNFHRLDGTVEEITLENITIHHEGGGTYAEITYRKGIC